SSEHTRGSTFFLLSLLPYLPSLPPCSYSPALNLTLHRTRSLPAASAPKARSRPVSSAAVPRLVNKPPTKRQSEQIRDGDNHPGLVRPSHSGSNRRVSDPCAREPKFRSARCRRNRVAVDSSGET